MDGQAPHLFSNEIFLPFRTQLKVRLWTVLAHFISMRNFAFNSYDDFAFTHFFLCVTGFRPRPSKKKFDAILFPRFAMLRIDMNVRAL